MQHFARKILVVDDDASVRRSICRLLYEFRVVTATGLQDAQRLWSEHSDIDAVISDYRMPDGTGLDLFRWIRGRRATPFVLISGDFVPATILTGGFQFLRKPFDSTALTSTLHSILASDFTDEAYVTGV